MANNQLESLNDIFTQRLFRIPDYQRGYAWEAKKQLKDFWEDIVNLPWGRSHYTGLLSIKRVPKSVWRTWVNEEWLITGKKYVPFYVVDGQQRLSTFVIFIQSIVNFIKQLPENANRDENEIDVGEYSLKEVVEKYLVEMKRNDIIKTYKFGYEDDNPSFLFLKHRILGEPNAGKIDETFYTLNLENAKNFFDENISNYYGTNKIAGIIRLFEKATQSMMFNIYEIDDDFDVFAAFETMNNRGKKLSNLELMKSRLIYLTTLFTDEQMDADERIVVRNKINDAWKEVYYQLGRNKKYPLSDDEFLRAHWILKYQFSNKRGDDYINFLLNKEFVTKNIFNTVTTKMTSVIETEVKTDIDTDDEETEQVNDIEIKSSTLTPRYIVDYVDSLKEVSKYWYITNFPQDSTEITEAEKKWLDRLNRLGMAYFRPLLVAAFLSPKSSESDRLNLFKEIERFIFIAFRMSGAYSTYNQNQVNRMVRKVYRGKLNINDVSKNIRNRIENWVHPADKFDYHPFKDKIQRHFNDGGGFYYWGALRYLLFEYEDDMVAKNGNAQKALDFFIKGKKDKVSVEHIYPQTPKNDYWKKKFEGYSEKQKLLLSSSLGNLLPLSMSVNASLQNDSFPDKKANKYDANGKLIRRGYTDGSHSETEVSKYVDWDANAILARGLKLLRFMEQRWDLQFENEEAMIDMIFIGFVRDKQQSNN